MSIGTINSEQSIWGAASLKGPNRFGLKETEGGFEESLNNSFGFGARDESGGLAGDLPGSAKSLTSDLLSQIQFSLLRNNSAESDQRLDTSLL
jgi:hypothetical protein